MNLYFQGQQGFVFQYSDWADYMSSVVVSKCSGSMNIPLPPTIFISFCSAVGGNQMAKEDERSLNAVIILNVK